MVRLEIKGTEEVQAELMELVKRSSNFSVPLRAFGAHTKSIAARSIKEQADPVTGTKWPSLHGLTLRLRPDGEARKLNSTGRLLKSFLAAKVEVTPYTVTVGSSGVPYALIHQLGGVVKAKPGKFLAIPLTRKAANAGSASRWWASAEKPHFEGRTIAGGKPSKPAFALLQSVTIPARPYLGFRAEDHQLLLGLLRAYLTPKAPKTT
jgi:phage gpG-like protein